jgi:hypothetical protein
MNPSVNALLADYSTALLAGILWLKIEKQLKLTPHSHRLQFNHEITYTTYKSKCMTGSKYS